MVELLVVPEGTRVSELERLRTPPVKPTGTAMVRAMERVEEISAFALGRVNLSRVPMNRLSRWGWPGGWCRSRAGGGGGLDAMASRTRFTLLAVVVADWEAVGGAGPR
ncbi:hypothetical protein OG510_31445 [Streptomyces sp. NBC_01089]|nr:hypothetical protein OG510_31445 [Streptomyces sp. NBC_01089]